MRNNYDGTTLNLTDFNSAEKAQREGGEHIIL